MDNVSVWYHVYTQGVYTCTILNPKTAILSDNNGGFFLDTRDLMTKYWVRLGDL